MFQVKGNYTVKKKKTKKTMNKNNWLGWTGSFASLSQAELFVDATSCVLVGVFMLPDS